MKELLDFAFTGVNIIPTILLIFVSVYWLIVVLGVVDTEALDIDVDADVDMDGFASVLSFFNIDQMPLMIFVTFYTIPLWAGTLIFNDLLGFESFFSGMLVFLPVAFVSLFLSKFMTTPFALFYRKVRSQTEAVEHIVGQICIAKLRITDDRKSQAEIKVNGTSVLIYVKTKEGLTVEKGGAALVIDYEQENNTYYVEPYQL